MSTPTTSAAATTHASDDSRQSQRFGVGGAVAVLLVALAVSLTRAGTLRRRRF